MTSDHIQIKIKMPNPSHEPTAPTKTHTLIQCRWDDPVNSTSKDSIKAHLERANFEFASFNHTSHLLNITTKINDHDQTLDHLRSKTYPPAYRQTHTHTNKHSHTHIP